MRLNSINAASKDVVEHAAAVLIAAMAAWAIFAVWGVNLAQSGTIVHAV